jgi:hypothetical protein
MEGWSIHVPRPRAAAPPDAASVHTESALARARYRAKAAAEDLDQLIAAAGAAARTGTWTPCAAKSFDDYALLSAAEDDVARHQRKRQRR